MSVISVAVSESEQIEDTITNSTQQQLLRTQVHFVSDALFFFQYAQGSFQESGVVASLGVTVLFFFFCQHRGKHNMLFDRHAYVYKAHKCEMLLLTILFCVCVFFI
jgi:hypothetical protein